MKIYAEDTDSRSDQESQQRLPQVISNEPATEDQSSDSQCAARQQCKKTPKEKQWKTFPRESFQDFQPEVLEERTRSSRTLPAQEPGREERALYDDPSNSAGTGSDDSRSRHDIIEECSNPENAYSASIGRIEIPRSYEEAINDDLYGPE